MLLLVRYDTVQKKKKLGPTLTLDVELQLAQ